MADLKALMEKLTTTGPHKTEVTSRRVRGLYNGTYVFDTTKAMFVWEHAHYPYYYIPTSAFAKGVLMQDKIEHSQDLASVGKLVVGHKTNDRVVLFSSLVKEPLSGLVRIEFKSLDAWFVEDEQIYAHPKDPYCRIECIPSSRSIRIEVEGHIVAESTSNIFLYETGLRTRFYLPPTSVDRKVLTPSETTSYCPYKGQASYFDIHVGGHEIKDAVWYYTYPVAESLTIAGKICFYNEKVDIFIEGVKE